MTVVLQDSHGARETYKTTSRPDLKVSDYSHKLITMTVNNASATNAGKSPKRKSNEMSDNELFQSSGLKKTSKTSGSYQKDPNQLTMSKFVQSAPADTNATASTSRKAKQNLKSSSDPPEVKPALIPPLTPKAPKPKSQSSSMSKTKPNLKSSSSTIKEINKATLQATLKAKTNQHQSNSGVKTRKVKVPQTSSKSTTAPQQQDDDSDSGFDTVVSGETINKEKTNDEKNCWRFALSVTFETIDHEEFLTTRNIKELPNWVTDPGLRLRNRFMSWFKELKTQDSNIRVLAWKKSDSKNVIERPEQLPSSKDKRKIYFQNIDSVVESGMMYPQVRLFTIKDPDVLAELMKAWCQDNNMTMSKSLVQSEYHIKIGWFVYSSPFTNWIIIKAKLEQKTGFEWGFKMGYVSNDDRTDEDGNPVQWNRRVRALGVHVSRRHLEEAKKVMESIFGYKKQRSSNFDFFPMAKTLIFLPTEHLLNNTPNLVSVYRTLKQRHATFSRGLDGEFSSMFTSSIDKIIHTPNHGSISMRDMVLSIPLRSSRNTPLPLFLDIDATMPGQRTYFSGGRRNDGSVGHIFSFLGTHLDEARLMIRGLPIFLSALYGERTVLTKFTAEAWENVAGWSFNKDTYTFSNPEAEWLEEVAQNDPLAAVWAHVENNVDQAQERNNNADAPANNQVGNLAEAANQLAQQA